MSNTACLHFKPVFTENGVILPDSPDFRLSETLDCGQAFRWAPLVDGFIGVVQNKICHISHLDNRLFLKGVSPEDFENIWRRYFDLDRDYGALKTLFSQDGVLSKAVSYCPGIRVLRQDPWEALCSFIISQNNHIPRIKAIIERLCRRFGAPLGGDFYGFPGPERLACLNPGDLEDLRAGFRVRYLLDAARRVSAGEVDLTALETMPLDQARKSLQSITGVGPKVAQCTLLYGCGRVDCVPMDVWMIRVMERLYPQGLPSCTEGCAGIAQQYLFHWARTCPGALEGETLKAD